MHGEKRDRVSQQLCTHMISKYAAQVTEQLDGLAAEISRQGVTRAQQFEQLRRDIQAALQEAKEAAGRDGGMRELSILSMQAEAGLKYSAELAVLERLKFEGFEDREDTFPWGFASADTNETGFTEWLSSSESIFWISGKAGSGKSTCMKYVFSHPLCRSHLERWAKDRRLVIASFFFWFAGKRSLLKTLEGLLRSILYQILSGCPRIIPRVLPYEWQREIAGEAVLPKSGVDFWTAADYLKALRQACTHLADNGVNFCFFIDGLDEYQGKPHDVIQAIEILQSCSRVKVCVASRPWNEFEQAFGQDASRKLYMQSLTKPDIMLYIQDKLCKDATFLERQQGEDCVDDLVSEIADSAQGVFLWVHLVVKSLLEGLANGDWIDDLRRRLRGYPQDLDHFFERVLFFDVDRFYRKSSALLFLVTREAFASLPLLAYWHIDRPLPSEPSGEATQSLTPKSAGSRITQMQKRLNACCKGLLETQRPPSKPIDTSSLFATLHGTEVHFLHRTVADYMREDGTEKLLQTWAETEINLHATTAKGVVAHIKEAYVDLGQDKSSTEYIAGLMTEVFAHIVAMESSGAAQLCFEASVSLLDDLQLVLESSGATLQTAVLETLEMEWLLLADFHKSCIVMLLLCLNRRLYRLVDYEMSRNPELFELFSAVYLYFTVETITRGERNATHWGMGQMIMVRGACANSRIHDGEDWARFLTFLERGGRINHDNGTAYEIILRLLPKSANLFNKDKWDVRYDLIDVVRKMISAEHAETLEAVILKESPDLYLPHYFRKEDQPWN